MQAELFTHYKQALARGERALARKLLLEFIDSFGSLDEKQQWSLDYLRNRENASPIRHELYTGVIFPVLLAGYRQNDPDCLYWLEMTAPNLYRAEQLWAQVDHLSAREFCTRLLVLRPDDMKTRQRLLSIFIEGFRYAEHEWPAGILSGNNGANAEECDEILADITEAKTLAPDEQQTSYLAAFREKVALYRARLNAQTNIPAKSCGQPAKTGKILPCTTNPKA